MSTSGYYRWINKGLAPEDDLHVDLITLIFQVKNEKAGARTIKMILWRDFEIQMNLKKIRRLMKKIGLITKIRVKNKYTPWKVGVEHLALPNLIQQKFEMEAPDEVYSADITYLPYGGGLTAYLFAVKDLYTKEILHYRVSKRMDLSLVLEGHEKLYSRLSDKILKNLIVHSDQGCHFTAKEYRALLERNGVRQSMSRKGNCLDNAPIESFFGHMKDEIELLGCTKVEEVENAVQKYIDYYNNQRPQWTLKRKTPAECRGSKSGALF